MAVGYRVVWQDGHGVERATFEKPGYDTRLAQPDVIQGTKCLQFVDPYGDTIFNQLQLPVFIEELEAVVERAGEANLAGSVGELVRFLRACQGHIHTYVKVVGD